MAARWSNASHPYPLLAAGIVFATRLRAGEY